MSITSPRTLASLFAAAALVVACAASDEPIGPGSTVVDAGGGGNVVDSSNTTQDTYVPPEDTGTGADIGPETGPGCPSSCNADSECQIACVTPPSGSIDCCDVMTHVCYVASQVCQGSAGDSGMTPPY